MPEVVATGVGRRKCAIARIKLVPGKGRIFINNRTTKDYFGNRAALEMMIYQPLVLTENETKFDVRVKVVGGGVSSQAGAIRHGISRALLMQNLCHEYQLKMDRLQHYLR
ncbi:MAG: 30S ribosomal protein S9 [Parcubacteria group bacterium GW2011_GWC2_32_10]|nr:MAG: 30S ribosomal protein S9 [Parcubacteria group bacterium GW2011_GWC2_32_10]